MTELMITHRYAEGTLLEGDPRPHHKILKTAGMGWRFSKNLPFGEGWYIASTRDTVLTPWRQQRLNEIADLLRAAGFDVTVEIDNTPRSAAETQADKDDRLDDREDRLETRAQRLDKEGRALLDEAHTMASVIPFGQPMMPDHYSYNRDRNYRDRIHNKQGKAFATLAQAREVARQAASVGHRRDESINTLQNRINKLGAELRDLERKIDDPDFESSDLGRDDAWRQYIFDKYTEVTGKLDFWEQVLVDREAAGEKVWRREDFEKGDRVQASWGWGTVDRANPKTLSVVWDIQSGFTQTISYSKITGRDRPAA